MAKLIWHVGDTARLGITFEIDGSPTDPTTITLTMVDPSGNQDPYTYALAEVTKSGTGVYYKDVTLDESGLWYYRWAGTGTVAAADEGEIDVLRSVIE